LEAIPNSGELSQKAVARFSWLLKGERWRRLVFAGDREPGLPLTAPSYAATHLNAIRQIKNGEVESAAESFEEAARLREPVRGAVNGEPITDLKDASDVVGLSSR